MASGSAKIDGATPRILVVMGLLATSLIATIVLAYQANLAASSHLRTAQNVLREYAALVADEFTRRSFVEAGFFGFYQLSNALRTADGAGDDWQSLRANPDAKTQRALPLAAWFFDYEIDSARLTVEGGAAQTWLRPHLNELAASARERDESFHLQRLTAGGEARTLAFILAQRENGLLLRGFAVDRAAFGTSFGRAFDKGPLLPESLANGAIANDVLYLRVVNADGQALFQAGQRYDPYLTVNKAIGDDYQGILEGLIVTASIDPAVAPSLVIGGLPRSRLPLLIGLMILTTGLVGAALWILRGEQSLMKMRSEFVAQVSHELRTPLSQIRMFSETLLMDRVRNADERRQYLEIINREAQRLTHLVDNVLRFSHHDGGLGLQATVTRLATLVDAVVAEYTALEPALTIRTQLDDTLKVMADADAVRQILLNLLDNAHKYGPAGQTVTVALAAHGDMARLTVSDGGPGIAPDERDRVWQAFYRLDRDQHNGVAGTGIGLAIVRSLATELGGGASVDAAWADGARIVVDLPLVNGSQS